MLPRRLKQLSILILIASLTLLGVASLLTIAVSMSLNENRILTELPKKPENLEELKEWPTKFESYLNDHIAFRGDLTKIYSLYRIKIGLPPQEKVIVGKDNWMFGNFGVIVPDYRNVIPFSKSEVQRWINYLKYNQKLAQKNNYHYFFILIPNKATVYPEQLPYYIKKVNPTGRFDQIKEAAAKEGIHLIDLRQDMRNAKTQGRLYSPYDSHWNLRGVEVAHLKLLRTLQKNYPDIKAKPLPADGYIDVNREEMLKHAVFNWGYLWNLGLLHEKQFIHKQPLHHLLKKQTRPYTTTQLEVEDAIKNRISERHFKKNYFKTENPQAPIDLRLLIFRDSFATLWQHFLSKDFSYVAYIREQPDMLLINSSIKTYQPDIVIEERVERSLTYVPVPGIDYPSPSDKNL